MEHALHRLYGVDAPDHSDIKQLPTIKGHTVDLLIFYGAALGSIPKAPILG